MAADHVYVPLQSGTVVAYRIADGAEVWRKEIRPDEPLSADNDHLYVAAEEAIYAFNHDGTAAWHVESGALTAPLFTRDGWIVAASEAHVSAYRAVDGSRVWQHEGGTARQRVSVEGNRLYVPTEDGRLLAIDLQTGAVQWERRFRGALSDVLPLPERIFVGSADKYFYCLRTGDGSVDWKTLIGTALRGRPAADADRVYVIALDNQVRAYDRRNGALRWPMRGVPFRSAGGPLVIGKMIIVAGLAPEVHAFNTANGDALGKITLAAPLVAAPSIAETPREVMMAAVTGDLNAQFKLSLLGEPPPPVPSLELAPLTALPGQPVPAGRGTH